MVIAVVGAGCLLERFSLARSGALASGAEGARSGADGAPEGVSGRPARRDELASVPVSGAATTNSVTTAAAVALNMQARRTVRFRRAPTSLRIAIPLNFPPYSLCEKGYCPSELGNLHYAMTIGTTDAHRHRVATVRRHATPVAERVLPYGRGVCCAWGERANVSVAAR